MPYSGGVWIALSGNTEAMPAAATRPAAMQIRNRRAPPLASRVAGLALISELEVEELILRSDENESDKARNAGDKTATRNRQFPVFDEQRLSPLHHPHRVRQQDR